MKRVSYLRRFSEFLLRTRWLLVVLTATIVIVVELEEHNQQSRLMADFWRETILFGFVIPFTYGLLLSLLFHTRQEKDDAEHTMEQIARLNNQLSRILDWASVTSTIVNFPKTVLPAVGSSLRVYNPETEYYELVDYWLDDPSHNVEQFKDLSRETCERCDVRSTEAGTIPENCPVLAPASLPASLHSYCVPLANKDKIVAILHVYFVQKPEISPRIARLLRDTAPEMALAIETARLQQSAENQLEATNIERKRIARDLHDTLGQNISYLRLKLDQITGEDALHEISMIRGELERMRDIADVAYLQVRNTLAELQPDTQLDLPGAMRELLTQVSRRAGFEPVFEMRGQPKPLSTNNRRQLLFIFREVMNNIEKHARAQNVVVSLIWDAGSVDLEIHDDGRGFHTNDTGQTGHYGMEIMQERAREIGANFQINSIPGEGTCISLCLPLAQKNQATHQSLYATRIQDLPTTPNRKS